MPTLEWMGKDKVIGYHRQVPYRVLDSVPAKGILATDGSDRGNKIIHGDNLEALKSLLPEYGGRVDCVYIEIILPSLIQRTGIIKKCAFAV